jgi:hypothetical protein
VSKADSDTQKQLLFEEVAPEDGLFAGKIGDLCLWSSFWSHTKYYTFCPLEKQALIPPDKSSNSV